MKTCPECKYPVRGNRCSCGWEDTESGRAKKTGDNSAALLRSTLKTQAEAERWLASKGLLKRPFEVASDYLGRLNEYRSKLARLPKPDPRQWARDLMQKHDDGDYVPSLSLDMAREALETQPEDGE